MPQKLQNPADYQALCRLVNQSAVTPVAVLAPHLAQTRAALRAHRGVVLLLPRNAPGFSRLGGSPG